MNDKVLFTEILMVNPDIGVSHPEYQVRVESHRYMYYIPNWLKYKDKSMEGGYQVKS